ncbi:MAG: ankyrin repeat domain-containing protein, partial [Terriglobia bacterium]
RIIGLLQDAAAHDSTLTVAVFRGDLPKVSALLAAGANPNAADKSNGVTVLMVAATYGHTDIVRVLLEKGAKVDAQNREGATALMLASMQGHVETVRALLAKDANVNIKSNDGRTALSAATSGQHEEVVELLKQAETKETSELRAAILEALEPDAQKRREMTERLEAADKQIDQARQKIDLLKALQRADSTGQVQASPQGRAAPMTNGQRSELKSGAKLFEDVWLGSHPRKGLANYPFVVIQDDLEYKKLSPEIRDQIQLDLMPEAFRLGIGVDTYLKIFDEFSRRTVADGCSLGDRCYRDHAQALMDLGAKGLFPAMVQYEIVRVRHERNTGIAAPDVREMIRREIGRK